MFAPPFHFCRGIATEPANSLADPPSPRTRVGQKGRLLPHEAPFSFSGRPPPDIHQQEGFLARLREHRIPRVLPWPERRHHGLVAELAPYAISFLVDFPDGIIADRERQRWPWRRITTGSGQTCALKPRPLATGRRALPTSSCSPQLDNSIWPAQLQDSTRSRCG